MTFRWKLPVYGLIVLLITAFSTGSPALLVPAALLLLAVGFGCLSVRLAARTLQVSVKLTPDRVQRGEQVHMEIQARGTAFLPVAPVSIHLTSLPGEQQPVLKLKGNGTRRMSTTLIAQHVGVSRPGVQDCEVQDLFGLFTLKCRPQLKMNELLVIPQVFDVQQLTYAPGDPGVQTMARATEDISSPSDVRSYSPGDPIKKIHWKLSLRKRELLVRRFEQPALPDALVLMDCAPPPGDDPEQAADLQDALLETAASLLSLHSEGHTVRLPLLGDHPVQLVSNMPLPLMLENLARAQFTQADRFEQVLMMEGRRLSRVGSVVIITAHLNGAVVEAVTSISRMGPDVRVYLITEDPRSERNLRYVSRLQHAAIHVSYVRPMPV